MHVIDISIKYVMYLTREAHVCGVVTEYFLYFALGNHRHTYHFMHSILI